jgi:hypothetical protein
MGCRHTTQAGKDAGGRPDKESWEELENEVDVPAHAHPSSGYGRNPTSKEGPRSIASIEASQLREVLEKFGSNKVQLAFFDEYAKSIYSKAVVNADRFGQCYIFSTDARFLEVRITAATTFMVNLLTEFAESMGMPVTMLDEMKMVLEVAQATENLQDDPTMTIWCRFKNMRSESPPPSIDFGFFINQELYWNIIDVMMHPTADQDLLLAHATSESYNPILYGSSVVPTEPEKHLAFELHESATQNHRQILISAFFFFKSFGLMKPEDRVVRILNSCGCKQLVVTTGFGPKGLVRVVLSLCSLTAPLKTRADNPSVVAKELAKEIGFQYREDMFNNVMELLGGEPDIVEYVAETSGYSIRLGFTI